MAIRRRVGFYVYALIVPSVLLSFLMPLTFWIPPSGDGRITLGNLQFVPVRVRQWRSHTSGVMGRAHPLSGKYIFYGMWFLSVRGLRVGRLNGNGQKRMLQIDAPPCQKFLAMPLVCEVLESACVCLSVRPNVSPFAYRKIEWSLDSWAWPSVTSMLLVFVGDANLQQRTKVRRYNWHGVGSLGWPFPMLKYWYIFHIKYTDEILSNSTRKLLWFLN